MRSRSIITLAVLTLLALPIAAQAQEDDSFSPVGDAILARPFAFIMAAGGAAGVVVASPYSFCDGAVRSIVRSTRQDQTFLQGTGGFFVEGARGVARSFSDASWCPVEFAVTARLGERKSCDGIAWSQQGVYAP